MLDAKRPTVDQTDTWTVRLNGRRKVSYGMITATLDRRDQEWRIGTWMLRERRLPGPCVYRKLKLGRSGDEVRLGWQMT
jgi:hypothetical protein